MSTVKSHHGAPFTLRLRPELRTELEREAAINHRPLAQEIMLRLEQSMDRSRVPPGAPRGPMNTLAAMERVKLRDLPPFSLRLPPDMRASLQREAEIHGRTLSAEILQRLKLSLTTGAPLGSSATGAGDVLATSTPGRLPTRADSHSQSVTDTERMLLALFNTLPPDKQLALLKFLRR